MKKKIKDESFISKPLTEQEKKEIAAFVAEHRKKHPLTPQEKEEMKILQQRFQAEDYLKWEVEINKLKRLVAAGYTRREINQRLDRWINDVDDLPY